MPQFQAAEFRAKKKRQLPASVKLGIATQGEEEKLIKGNRGCSPVSAQAALCALCDCLRQIRMNAAGRGTVRKAMYRSLQNWRSPRRRPARSRS